MKNYVIITDVTSDMSPEIREHFGLDGYVHGYVHISDGRDVKTTLDWENISRDEYYAALNSKSLEVSTAPATPDEYYEIFAAVELKDSDFWYTFTDAKNESEFNYMMAYIRHNATVKNDTVPKYGDKIVTLSTCKSYTTSRDRIIIVGVKVANDQVR